MIYVTGVKLTPPPAALIPGPDRVAVVDSNLEDLSVKSGHLRLN